MKGMERIWYMGDQNIGSARALLFPGVHKPPVDKDVPFVLLSHGRLPPCFCLCHPSQATVVHHHPCGQGVR
jgi:hypothetical protein